MNARVVPDSLLFGVADALNMSLHLMADHFRGAEMKLLKLGFWSSKAEMTACSDILTKDVATFFVKVKGSVWLYFVNEQDKPSRVYAFDGASLGLRVKDMSTFGQPSLAGSLKKILPAVRGVFQYDDEQWERVDVTTLDKAS